MNPKMRKESESWSSKRKNEAEDAKRKGILVVKEDFPSMKSRILFIYYDLLCTLLKQLTIDFLTISKVNDFSSFHQFYQLPSHPSHKMID
ncbi:hypothetical protein MXL46_05595 [Heyndrickxia sporothermodurans]|uniref:hypothetical protein n=1 Tax=Heyndrickxia sporothermodurans TaxID=46224 RepID=UPI002DB78FFF|nr:hypothetical protein [Heyndrickxia sporothermodurans]MEB6548581.1 hypothetical protein [Heyndrickxia sporothermodurans]